jgi:hypothetical protein
MSTGLRYWRLVKIDAAGRCRTEEFTQAKAFFKRQFSETNASDADIQRQMLRLLRQESSFWSSFRSSIALGNRCILIHIYDSR